MSSTLSAHVCINETVFQAPRQPTVDVSITFPPNSRWTQQCFKDEADINTIMARYQSTGEMPVLNEQPPQYLDASGFDFQAMQDQVVEAKALFGQLPSILRNRFSNDPALFLDYVRDPDNYPEMRKLGLLRPDSEGAQGGYPRAPIADVPVPPGPSKEVKTPSPSDDKKTS